MPTAGHNGRALRHRGTRARAIAGTLLVPLAATLAVVMAPAPAGADIGTFNGGWSRGITTATASADGPYSDPEGSPVTLSGLVEPDRVTTIAVDPPANVAPVADAGPAQTVNPADTVTLDGTGSSDPDTDPLTYSWTQTSGPAVTLTGATTAQPTFTAPAGPATVTFELSVCDSGPLCDTDTVTVTVNGPPPPPECRGLEVTVNLSLGQSPTNGPDVIQGTSGDDIIHALGGADVICGGSGDDIMSGDEGRDRIFGSFGDDELRGNAGADVLRGRAGDDTLFGQAGKDLLDGGADRDSCRAGTGVDTAIACEAVFGVP